MSKDIIVVNGKKYKIIKEEISKPPLPKKIEKEFQTKAKQLSKRNIEFKYSGFNFSSKCAWKDVGYFTVEEFTIKELTPAQLRCFEELGGDYLYDEIQRLTEESKQGEKYQEEIEKFCEELDELHEDYDIPHKQYMKMVYGKK